MSYFQLKYVYYLNKRGRFVEFVIQTPALWSAWCTETRSGLSVKETRNPIAVIVLIVGLHKTRRCPGTGPQSRCFLWSQKPDGTLTQNKSTSRLGQWFPTEGSRDFHGQRSHMIFYWNSRERTCLSKDCGGISLIQISTKWCSGQQV